MKLKCGFFSLIFAILFILFINNVTSKEIEFETETESMATALATTADNGDRNKSVELTSDEIKSDEIDENYENDDISDTITSGGMDMIGMQIGTDQVAPIVNQILGPISSTIQPYLGPLAPLSSVIGSIITHTVTELIVNLINETVASTKRQDFMQIRNLNYTSFLVTVPNNGRFLLLTKTKPSHKKPKRF